SVKAIVVDGLAAKRIPDKDILDSSACTNCVKVLAVIVRLESGIGVATNVDQKFATPGFQVSEKFMPWSIAIADAIELSHISEALLDDSVVPTYSADTPHPPHQAHG